MGGDSATRRAVKEATLRKAAAASALGPEMMRVPRMQRTNAGLSNHGVARIALDGQVQQTSNGRIPLADDGTSHTVEVLLG